MKRLSFYLKQKGYVYTAMTIALILITLSLIGFYFSISERKTEDSVKRISLGELHYLVGNIKEDYSNALEISGRRSVTYAIGYILNSSQNFSGYEMTNCTSFNYSSLVMNGSQAVIAELMLCGSLFGAKKKEMENNTLLNWSQTVEERFKGEKWRVDLEIKNLTLVSKDSWTLAIFSTLEILASDLENKAQMKENVSVTSLVSILGLEDPLYYLKTNESDLMRKFYPCQEEEVVDGPLIQEWIDKGCYQSSNLSYNGSGIFDRLEGNLNLSERYVRQHREYFSSDEIGLESLIDVYQLYLHNLTNYEENYTWVDYLFWQKVKGTCNVTGTKSYQKNGETIEFWIDKDHKEKYNIVGATCF